MSNNIADYTSQVHDNIVQSYFVDFANGLLRMNTCRGNIENTIIEFTGLLAHKFENVLTSNIIFGLYQTTIRSFIEGKKENLSESLKYGFPSMKAQNCAELRKELEKEQYKIFYFDSSLGLYGYVIAKDIRIIIDTK